MQSTIESPKQLLSLSQTEIDDLVAAQKHFFDSGVTRSYAFRKGQLNTLKAAIKRHEKALLDALYSDLRKNEFESYSTEVGFAYSDISHTLNHLRQWMQPRRVNTPIMFAPGSSRVLPDPLGTVLIISPWNYPVNLMLSPLVAAIAGGNTILLKPSEIAPATEAAITKMIEETFEPEYIAVIRGEGQGLGPQLIERHHLDHVFYTGSTAVGKIIMQHAAKQLTPVTLELGGKSPCVVDETANIKWAAKKIAWSKFINAGQTCVAPDYVLVHDSVKQALIKAIQTRITDMFGSNPQQSPDYPRIINHKRFDTLAAYLTSGQVLAGGQQDREDKFIGPTLLENNDSDSPVWQEEIFGPILLIRSYNTPEEAMQIINENPYPLAFYLYTSSKASERYFTERLRFGGACINNGLIHLGNNDLPFGGVGFSGMGQYHGKAGFETFTRPKSILKSYTWFDTPVWYAPVKDGYMKALRLLMR
jgi:aldehyde dehydrogenase (NAD+)